MRGIGVAVSVRTSTWVLRLLDALLVGDAEALLLVDHEQAEVLEAHVGGEQAVRADDDVELALGELGHGRRPAPSSTGSASACRARTPKPLKRSVERAEVLLDEHGGRREQARLLAALHAP